MASQNPKISLEEAFQAALRVLNAWPGRAPVPLMTPASWAAYQAAEVDAVAPLIALGAVISDPHPATGRRMRFGGVSATCTSSMKGLVLNWAAGASRRLTAEDRS